MLSAVLSQLTITSYLYCYATLMRLHSSNLLKRVRHSTLNLRYCTRLFYLVFFSSLVIFSPSLQAKKQSIEYKIKAAYLYNFSKFTTWPADISFEEGQSFTICILGKDPFGTVITPIENKTVHGQQIKLLYFLHMHPDVSECKIVFIAETRSKKVQSILKTLSGLSILTVGQSSQFAITGGIIGFVIQNNRVQFQINETAAQRAQLFFDSRLLRLGQRVTTKQ